MPRLVLPKLALALMCSFGLSGHAAAAATETILYNFGIAVGQYPSRPVADSAGNLYGVAGSGGLDNCSPYGRCGTVFELLPPTGTRTGWTGRGLYQFTSMADGYRPVGEIARGADGTLYGVAGGGAVGRGIAFSLKPPTTAGQPWTKTTIFNFANTKGEFPRAGLTMDGTGALYGTTSQGGDRACPDGRDDGCGVVFKLTPPAKGALWTQTILHTFEGGTDGAYPSAEVRLDAEGAVYGTTAGLPPNDQTTTRYSTTFKLTPPTGNATTWTMHILHDFDLRDAAASGPLLLSGDGSIIGTTIPTIVSGACISKADPVYGCGTIYKLAPPPADGGTPALTVLHTFGAIATGIFPRDGVIPGPNGSFYGVTQEGGTAPCECGVAFRLLRPATGQTQWKALRLYSFAYKPDGASPERPMLESNGSLIGIASGGGTGGCANCSLGALYQIVP